MGNPREPWDIRPATKKFPVTDSVKSEVQSKADDLIRNVLKPTHVCAPKGNAEFNYITDIGAKWFRNYFYFFSTYACPSSTSQFPSFESKFARIEPLSDGKFALYFMRHTGNEWVGIFDELTIDECMQAIQDGDWFAP